MRFFRWIRRRVLSRIFDIHPRAARGPFVRVTDGEDDAGETEAEKWGSEFEALADPPEHPMCRREFAPVSTVITDEERARILSENVAPSFRIDTDLVVPARVVDPEVDSDPVPNVMRKLIPRRVSEEPARVYRPIAAPGDRRERCPICGVVMHGIKHYGSSEACARVRFLSREFEISTLRVKELESQLRNAIVERDTAIADLGRAEELIPADVSRLKALISTDQTGLAAGLNECRRIVRGYGWIPAREWGSYEWEERTMETLRSEIGWCLEAIENTALSALHESGKRADAAWRRAGFTSEPGPL